MPLKNYTYNLFSCTYLPNYDDKRCLRTILSTILLHKYAYTKCWRLVFGVLDKHPDLIDSTCPLMHTTLAMRAAEYGNLDVLDNLKSRGANFSISDSFGRSVFDYALHHAEIFTIAKVISWLKGNTDNTFKDPMFYQSSQANWTVSSRPSS